MKELLRHLYKIFGKLDQKEGWLNLDCIYCPCGDSNKHLGIDLNKKIVHCFKCGKHLSLEIFLRDVNCNIGVQNITVDIPYVYEHKLIFPKEYTYILDLGSSSSEEDALVYIDKRIGLELASILGVGFCRYGYYKDRIIVPMYDNAGDVIYYIARAIYDNLILYDKPKKVLNPRGKKNVIFNLHIANNFPEVYLMEGVFGAIVMYPNSIAILGKEINESQVLQLVNSSINILNICLDGGTMKFGVKIADKILRLTNRIKIRILELGEGNQPDTLGGSKIIEIKNNTPFYDGGI